jgi:pimeloyl-ACP methyl ester carboxylesterase
MKAHHPVRLPKCALVLLITLVSLLAWPQQDTGTGPEGAYVANGEVEIWYRVEGKITRDSVPLLVLHGGPGATARPFERTIGPEIARNRAVVYMDYRGAGRSDRPKDASKYSFAILASDAEAIRQHLGIEKWAVFGHSNGGATAITYALNYPNRVVALVLCDPLLSPADLEMNMIHKVALAPADKYEMARKIYKSDKSLDERFGQLLDLIDIKTRYRFQYYDPENSAVLERIQGE